MNTTNLQGKIAFITGGARGIGLETARGLARLGATVVIGARNPEKAYGAADQLRKEGLQAVSIPFDVTAHRDHEEAYRYFEDNFSRLDILINNAGVLLDQESISVQTVNRTSILSSKNLRDTFEVNFFSLIELTQTLLPLIRRSEGGRIVNLSSVLGSLAVQADPSSPYYPIKTFAYNASKAALNAFTIHLAAELKDTNIKVNSVHPGWVRTELGGQYADMDEAAGAETSILLASITKDGPTGGFFHKDTTVPW
ncbi:short-chain dehydrogenase [Paenibacillus yonginensis]|uniref:Short-chain dehydrogenase n=1 Tax=Paenibacillus yonginensis TaxID=1462996 RepID=A0A1B1N479_9BACL|nr:SDR family oxidoreductase [Paenibacillus yonginensis]ANS76212.1 short-chain dehydrogenase [Paenibacillus yonginensis]